jgi:hypothetical protein
MTASTTPVFTKTPKIGIAVLGTFDASMTAPAGAQVSTVFTAGADGSKIEEIVVEANATLAAGLVNLWLHDGSTLRLFDQVQLATTPAMSTTARGFRLPNQYANLVLPAGWSLRASHTTTGNDTSKLTVLAFGGDF